MSTFTMGFDSEEFDMELDSAATPSSESSFTPRKRQKPMPVLGGEVTFAKAGRLELKFKDEAGKERKRYPAEMQIIILNSSFGRQQWETVDEKNRIACQTVSHSIKSKSGEEKEIEGGIWQLPYGAKLTNEKYNPQGQKSNGKLMSCADCMAEGKDEGCSQRGNIYAMVVGMTNEDDEMTPLKKPLLVTLKTPSASGISYQIYVLKELRGQRGYLPNQVVSRIGVQPTPNKLSNQLTFEMEDVAPASVVEEAKAALTSAMELWELEDKKKSEERRAKAQAAKGAAGGKGKGRAEPSAVAESDDGDFSF